jgi:putative ABC transport system permease protein
MIALALRNLWANKRRSLSTGLAVMLAVSFLAGTLVFSDTISRTFDDLFASVYRGTSAIVRSSTKLETQTGGTARGRIPESLIATVRNVDGVAVAEGQSEGYAQVVDKHGNALGDPGRGAPTFGMSWTSGTLSPWRLTKGSRPPGPGELVLDLATARKGGFKVGDVVTVLTQTGPHRFPLVGTTRFGSADSVDGATIALWDLPTAQRALLGRTGMVDAIAVAARPGISQQDITQRISAVLPKGTEAVTGAQVTRENQQQIHKAFSFFDTILLVFAIIALVAAAFSIFNTFQILVTQRNKEMAMIRAIGATRGQVLGAQLVEAAVTALIASIAGLAFGVVIAMGLKGMLGVLGIAIPTTGIVFEARTVYVAIAVGLVVTVASAVLPSVRASRVRPIEALRDVAVEADVRLTRRVWEGVALIVGGGIVLGAGLAGQGVLWVGVGALFMLVGAFVLGPAIARPVLRVVGAPLPRVSGVVGELAEDNALRNPKRTARTGAALMLGVALVAAIMVIAASVKTWTRDVFNQQFHGDYVVSTTSYGFGGLSPKLTQAIGRLPQVQTATGVRVGMARVSNDKTNSDQLYIAVDPATAGNLFDIGMTSGAFDQLTPDGVLLHDARARALGVHVGDTINFTFLNGKTKALRVEGLYTKNQLASDFVVSHALHEQSGADQFDFSIYILKKPGVSDAAAFAAIQQLSNAYPNATLQSRSEYISSQAAQIDQLVNLMYGLLALAIIIALLSIANSLALSVHERTHELGLLRAVGMTRHQIRNLVRWESILIATLGTLLGLLLGLFFGWSISVTIRGGGLGTFTTPVLSLALLAVGAIAGGVLAVRRPAKRAAKLDVLRAIATQ